MCTRRPPVIPRRTGRRPERGIYLSLCVSKCTLTSHESSATRRAHAIRRVGIGEPRPLAHQPVDLVHFLGRIAVAHKVAEAWNKDVDPSKMGAAVDAVVS